MKSRRSPTIPMQALHAGRETKPESKVREENPASVISHSDQADEGALIEAGKTLQDPVDVHLPGPNNPPMKQGVLQMIAVNQIDRSPYQNRIINSHSEEFIADLAANITNEDLNSAILVRRKEDGRFELIAGEHRLEAFKRNGEELIPAIVKKMDDIQAAKATVLDNVFRRESSHYELFRGYKTLLDMKAFTSQSQLAKEVNISKMEMTRIMSFGKLPSEALEIISHRSEMITSSVAYQLCEYTELHPDLVVKAITKIIGEDLHPQRAYGWIQAQVSPKEKGVPRSITDTAGKTVFTMKGTGSNIQIQISDKSKFNDLEKEIFEFLEDIARKEPGRD